MSTPQSSQEQAALVEPEMPFRIDAAGVYGGRGRPPELCAECRREKVAARKRAYYEANWGKVAARKRAAAIAAGRICKDCGEKLARPMPDGICWFCAQGIPA